MRNPSFDNLTEICRSLDDLKSDFRTPNLYHLLVSLLKKRSVLDIGCGVGHFLYLAKQKGFTVSGLEPNEDLIKFSKELYSDASLNIQNQFVENIGQVQGSYDNVTIIDVLEHIEDDVHLLKEIRRFLNPDGQLIILVPCFPHLYSAHDQAIGHFRRYTKGELIHKLIESGFQVSSIRYWNMISYLPYFVFGKILKKPLGLEMRTKSGTAKGFKKYVNRGLNFWFRHIENHRNFGFGLSLLCVAKLDSNRPRAKMQEKLAEKHCGIK